MRKRGFLIISMLFIFLLSGCVNDDIKKEYIGNIKCDLFTAEEIVFVTSLNTSDSQEFVYLKDHKVFIINYDKLFSSTDQNCKYFGEIADEVIGIKGITLFTGKKQTKDYFINTKWYDEMAIKQYHWENISDEKLIDSLMIFDKFYFKNESFYSADHQLIDAPFEIDEKIVTVYYQGRYIKTNKHIYKFVKKEINSDKCREYADVKCEYKYSFEIDKSYDQYYSDILYITIFSDSTFYKTSDWFYMIILKNGKYVVLNPPVKQ